MALRFALIVAALFAVAFAEPKPPSDPVAPPSISFEAPTSTTATVPGGPLDLKKVSVDKKGSLPSGTGKLPVSPPRTLKLPADILKGTPEVESVGPAKRPAKISDKSARRPPYYRNSLNGVFILCERSGWPARPSARLFTSSSSNNLRVWSTGTCKPSYVRGSLNPWSWNMYNHASLKWLLPSSHRFDSLKTYRETMYGCTGRGRVWVVRKYFGYFWWPVHACTAGYEAHAVEFNMRY